MFYCHGGCGYYVPIVRRGWCDDGLDGDVFWAGRWRVLCRHGGCGYYVIWCVLVELVPVAGVMADGFDGVLPERLWLHFIHEVARLR